jgi:hypothetical protein
MHIKLNLLKTIDFLEIKSTRRNDLIKTVYHIQFKVNEFKEIKQNRNSKKEQLIIYKQKIDIKNKVKKFSNIQESKN